MGIWIFFGIVALLVGIGISIATSHILAFIIGLCILILLIVGTNTRLFALTTVLGGVAIAIYYVAGGAYWVYMLVILFIALMKAIKFFGNREEMYEVWDEVTLDEKLYGWVLDQDASDIILFLLCLPCLLFFAILAFVPYITEVRWLAFLPAAFLLYRFVRVVQTTDDWDWD